MKKILIKKDAEKLFNEHVEIIERLKGSRNIVQNETILEYNDFLEFQEMIENNISFLLEWQLKVNQYIMGNLHDEDSKEYIEFKDYLENR